MSWPAAYREQFPCPLGECKYPREVSEAPAGLYSDDDMICVNCAWSRKEATEDRVSDIYINLHGTKPDRWLLTKILAVLNTRKAP